MGVSLYLSASGFLIMALFSDTGPPPAYGHHPPSETVNIFSGLAHLPTMVWVILLAVLGVAMLAIVAILAAKPKKLNK